MPQSSDEMRNLMYQWFGDGLDENGPIKLLESHGFELMKGWTWKKPCVSHTINQIEWMCIRFLIEEWDFDGVYATFDYESGGITYHGKARAST